MVSSKKGKEKEKKQDNIQVRSDIETDDNRSKKKKSSKGWHGKKSKKISHTDVPDYSTRHEASAPSNIGRLNENDQYGINANNDIGGIRQDYNRSRNFDENHNVTSYRSANEPDYSYSYEASESKNFTGNNPIPVPRKNIGFNDNYTTNSIQKGNENQDFNKQNNTKENPYKKKTSIEYSHGYNASASNNGEKMGYGNELESASQREVIEVMEKKFIAKGGPGRNNKTSNIKKVTEPESYVMGDSNEHFKRFNRLSIISKVTSSFSSNSSYKESERKNVQINKENIKGTRSHSASTATNQNNKNKTNVSMEKHVNVHAKTIPVLNANKSYNISFAMHNKYLEQNISSDIHNERKTIETVEFKKVISPKRKKSSKRIQTEIDNVDTKIQSNGSAFSPLMKDVDFNEGKRLNSLELTQNQAMVARGNNGGMMQTDNSSKSYTFRNQNNAVGDNNLALRNNNDKMQSSYSYGIRGKNNDMGGNNNESMQSSYSYGIKGNNNGMGGNNNEAMQSSYSYGIKGNNNGMGGNSNDMGGNYNERSGNYYEFGNNNVPVGNHYAKNGNNNTWNNADKGEAVYATENMVYKEWLEIEHPDGKREKREYKKERNNEGDLNYIDLQNGNILKIDKAEWKSGEELIKDKKNTRKVRYEWRKDPGTNEWVKYNSDTNEVIKRGDWKTGYEWYRTSKGKLSERLYTYIRNADSQWVKSDAKLGAIVDYSNCSALKGYKWIPTKKSGYGKTKNGKWKKQEYEYVQNNKGKWIKQEPTTKHKLSKPSNTGWKEGKEYHMDKNGKIKKVKYLWLTQSNGTMNKVNKKTKEPINTSWMQGREVMMRNNNVTTNTYSWVKNGRKKWIKIDEETNKPLTNNISSKKVSTFNQTEPQNKAYVSKVSKRTDNKIIEESTKLEQNGGNFIKNRTTSIQY